MKAEQRKELETNTLADKMGRVMTRVKTGQRRTYLIYLLIFVAVAIGLYFTYRYMVISRQETSMQWLEFDDGSAGHLNKLVNVEPPTAPAKAAMFQVAWMIYWEGGVKMIGADPAGSMERLRDASARYQKLAELCKDDAIFEPQALLGIAVVEETKAVQDRNFLDKSVEAYGEIVTKYPDSAAGKFAKGRLDQLKDKEGRKKIAVVYEDLQKALRVPGLERPGLGGLDNLPPFHPPIGGDDKKK